MQPQSQAFDLLMKAAFSIREWRKKDGRDVIATLPVSPCFRNMRAWSGAGSGEANREGPAARARYYLEEHSGEDDCLKSAARAAAGSRRSI